MVGRTSKIIRYGLEDEVIDMKKQGLSYQSIADTLNKNHTELTKTISKDCVHRYWSARQKVLKKDDKATPNDMVVLIEDVFQDLAYKVKTNEFDSVGRKALISHLKAKKQRLKSLAYKISSKHKDSISDKQIIVQALTTFSRCLCKECRERVNSAIEDGEDEL